MTDKEKKEWNELYDFMKYQILDYDKAQNLSRQTVLRLKGLTKGKFMDVPTMEQNASFSYRVVLLTFKVYRKQIIYGLNNHKFDDENHRINYVLKIVESHLNDIYIKYIKAQNYAKNLDNIDLNNIKKDENQIASYKTSDKQIPDTLKDAFEELW